MIKKKWWGSTGLNCRPSDYESAALTDLATTPKKCLRIATSSPPYLLAGYALATKTLSTLGFLRSLNLLKFLHIFNSQTDNNFIFTN